MTVKYKNTYIIEPVIDSVAHHIENKPKGRDNKKPHVNTLSTFTYIN